MSSQRGKAGSDKSGSSKHALAQSSNVVQALHQEHVARAASLALPKLAAQHSQSFVRLASISAAPDPALGPTVPSIRHRRPLWGDEVPNLTDAHQRNPRIRSFALCQTPPTSSDVLPEWYDLHNARCARCYLPQVPGINSVRPPPSTKLRRSRRQATDLHPTSTMPRSSRSSGGSRAAPSGSRGAHTMASNRPAGYSAPPPAAASHPQQHAPPVAQSQGPGLFGQMASTAAGVAVGSTVGHGLSNMLFGGRSEPAAESTQAPQPAYDQSQAFAQQQNAGVNCELQSRDFIKCLESTNDMNSCSYYLEQLKACQAAARPY